MGTQIKFVAILFSSFAFACGGQPAVVRVSQPPSYAPSGSSASGYASPNQNDGESLPASPPSGSRIEETPERAGLGTEWGETRVSRVHDVSFIRADEDRPFALVSMHYNDREGAESLAAFHGDRVSHFREIPSAGGAITISIRDSSGRALPATKTSDRIYVIGDEGERYSITLTNHTNHRFEALATVDGLDVISGKTGTFASRGYLLQPFATLDIDGFRQSHEAVAAFRFARVAKSYAALTSGDRNVGVIGVALFAEHGDSFDPNGDRDDLDLRDTARPFPGNEARFARPPR